MSTATIIDCHIHLVGDGTSGSNAWLAKGGFLRNFQQKLLLKSVGLDPALLDRGGIDQAYADFIVNAIEESSLTGAVLLAQDYMHDAEGKAHSEKSLFYVPNEYLLSIAQRSKKIIPAISIHPARNDAIEALQVYAARGAKVLKLLPNCHLVPCSEERFRPFWQKVSDLGLAFLAHTGGELVLTVNDKKLQDPSILRLPLECGVKVIAAHASTNSHPFDVNYIDVLEKMMQRYPNLYCDNSALLSPFRGRHLRALLQGIFAERVIHGSDVPVPVSAFWPWIWGQISYAQKQEALCYTNPLERDYQLKKMIGFPDAAFSRLATILPAYSPQANP